MGDTEYKGMEDVTLLDYAHDIQGKKMYVYCAIGGIAGVSASGEDRGSILRETDGWNPAVVAPSPVMLEGGKDLCYCRVWCRKHDA